MKFRLSRLAILLALSTLITALSGVLATYWVAKDEFRDVLDDDLENQSRLLAELLTSKSMRVDLNKLQDVLTKIFESKDEETLWVSVYNLDDGQLISNLQHSLALKDDEDGELALQLDGHHWFGFQHREKQLVVQLLRKDDRFDDILHEIYEDLTTPMLIVSGMNFLLLALFIGLVLRPLYRLAKELEARSAYSLAPLELKTPAREIAILRDTLNHLMSGIAQTLHRERQFANDVAHELRTPLTTLKLELASDEPDRVALKDEVDRLAQLVSQLLTLARVDLGHWSGSFEPVALDQVFSTELERQTHRMTAAGIEIQQNLDEVNVQGDAVLLEVLLRNLLNNILRHCPRGTRAHIDLAMTAQGLVLEVSDNGPGIDDEVMARLNAGFTRMDSRAGGLGLGLAICRKIADVHGAELIFSARDDGETGLQVSVIFPLKENTESKLS